MRLNYYQQSIAMRDSTCGNSFLMSTNPLDFQWTYPDYFANQTHGLSSSERVVELNEISDRRPLTCDVCGRCFHLAKTLYRHIRTVHSQPDFACSLCGLACKRKDILDRHIRERHSSTDTSVTCELCGKKLQSRCLPSHKGSAACKKPKRRIVTTVNPLSVSQRKQMPHTAAQLSSTDYLDAPADSIMLAAELFLKFKPWGSEGTAGWLRPASNPKVQSIEVLQLKDILFRTIGKAIASPSVARDTSVYDALTMLATVLCQSEGWDACKSHNKAFVALAALQIEASGSADSFRVTAAPDVYYTVARRHVAEQYVSKIETMIRMSNQLMRFTAAEYIHIMGLKFADKRGFDVVDQIDGQSWFEHNKTRIEAIAEIALTLDDHSLGSM